MYPTYVLLPVVIDKYSTVEPSLMDTPQQWMPVIQQTILNVCTVELPNNGHIGSGPFVLYIEVVPL